MTNKWQTKRLDQVSIVTMGQSPSSSSYNNQGKGVPFFQGKPSNIDSFGVAIPNQYTTEPTKVVEAGTALMTVRAPVGDIFISPVDVCIGRGLSGIKAEPDVSQKYLNYQLQFASQQFHTLSQGSTFTAINSTDLRGIQIGIPDINAQKKIADILSSIDEAIQKTDQIILKSEELKNGLMNELLTRGIGHKKFKKTKLGEIPENWEVMKFEDFAVLQRGFDLPVQRRTKGEYDLITSNGITDTNNEFKVSGPGVVTGRSGTLGKVFYVENNFWPLNTTLYIKDFHRNLERFAYYKIQHIDLSRYGTGTGVPTLNRNNVHKELIAVPNKSEQKKIVEMLSSVDIKILYNNQKKVSLLKLKSGLMYDIFNPKVQIK